MSPLHRGDMPTSAVTFPQFTTLGYQMAAEHLHRISHRVRENVIEVGG
jgi:hypothetical protein